MSRAASSPVAAWANWNCSVWKSAPVLPRQRGSSQLPCLSRRATSQRPPAVSTMPRASNHNG